MDTQGSLPPPAAAAAAGPSDVPSYPACSSPPPSSDAHISRSQRCWTPNIPSGSSQQKSTNGGSATSGDEATSPGVETVREGNSFDSPNSTNRDTRRNSKRMSIPLPPQLPPPNIPLPAPPGAQGRAPCARPPPMAYLASSPTTQTSFGDYNLPRSEQLVYSAPTPSPMPLGHPGPSPLGNLGHPSARSEREAYLSSALQLPLEMISELASPGFVQQQQQADSRPPSRPASPSKQGRVGAFLTRARSTVSLRSEKGSNQDHGGSDQSKQEGARGPTPTPAGRQSPVPDVPPLPAHYYASPDPAGPGPRPYVPVRRASHGVLQHPPPPNGIVDQPLRRGRSASAGTRPTGTSSPIQTGQLGQASPSQPLQPGQMARTPSRVRSPMTPAIPSQTAPAIQLPPTHLPPSSFQPSALSPVPQSPPSASKTASAENIRTKPVPKPVNVIPIRQDSLSPPVSPTEPARGGTPYLSRDGSRSAMAILNPHVAAATALEPQQPRRPSDPSVAPAPKPAKAPQHSPTAPAFPIATVPLSQSTAVGSGAERPRLKSASTERLSERLRHPSLNNAINSVTLTDSTAIESLESPAKKTSRLRVSMGWLHSRHRHEQADSQASDQRSVTSKNSISKFSDSGCSHTGSTRSKLSNIQDFKPDIKPPFSLLPRSSSQPNVQSKRHSLQSLPNPSAVQLQQSASHHHLPSADSGYPPGMITPQRQVRSQMPRGLPTPSPPHDRQDYDPMRNAPPPAWPPLRPPHRTPSKGGSVQPGGGGWGYQPTPLSPPASPRISQSVEHLPSHVSSPRKHKWLQKMWPFNSNKSNTSSPLSSPLGATVPQPTARHWPQERGRSAATTDNRRSRSMTPPRNRFAFHRNGNDKKSRRRDESGSTTAQMSMSTDQLALHRPTHGRKRSLSEPDHTKIGIGMSSAKPPPLPEKAATLRKHSYGAQNESVFDLGAAVKMNEAELGRRAAPAPPVVAH